MPTPISDITAALSDLQGARDHLLAEENARREAQGVQLIGAVLALGSGAAQALMSVQIADGRASGGNRRIRARIRGTRPAEGDTVRVELAADGRYWMTGKVSST